MRSRKNAGYTGKSNLATHSFRNEYEIRQLETKGGERCMSKKKDFDLDEVLNTLQVTYKVGRRSVNEEYTYIKEACDDPTLEMAIHDPERYWSCYYNTKFKSNKEVSITTTTTKTKKREREHEPKEKETPTKEKRKHEPEEKETPTKEKREQHNLKIAQELEKVKKLMKEGRYF